MDKEKIMNLCKQIGLVAMSNKKHYPALHSDFDFINNAQMDIFREITAPPKSNADRIRQMTDEELAELLDDVDINLCNFCAAQRTNTYYDCEEESCEKCVLAWLKQEVSEDAGTD